jgi:hypothetical protein
LVRDGLMSGHGLDTGQRAFSNVVAIHVIRRDYFRDFRKYIPSLTYADASPNRTGNRCVFFFACPQLLAFRPDAGTRRQALWVAGSPCLPICSFGLRSGDRLSGLYMGRPGMERLRILKGFAGLEGPVLPAMTGSPIVPGSISLCCCRGVSAGRWRSSVSRSLWPRWPPG